jgi:hypothetical protein
VASHFIANPLLINGLKIDLRIYVALTSINPLRIYVYDEGLARFATCPYRDVGSDTRANRYMHLTNYSINKFNKKAFVQNNDPSQLEGNLGSKWSLAGLKKELNKIGIDEYQIFRKIEDIIIKTIFWILLNQHKTPVIFIHYCHNIEKTPKLYESIMILIYKINRKEQGNNRFSE